MIVKKVPNPKRSSSKTRRIGSLLDYVESGHDDKVELRFVCGDFLTTSSQGQRAEMIALATEAKRSKDPVDHWIFSWKAGEQPTAEECRDAVEIFKQHLGMKPEHQAICVLHKNTENLHLHVVVNRTDPATHRVADSGWNIDRAHQAIAEIVAKQGWEPEANALYSPQKQQFAKETSARLSTRARDFENATGAESVERIAREQVPARMRDAGTWSELHASLASIGVRYEQKGSGALLWVNGTPVKASTIGREFSRKRLEERLGDFTAAASEVDSEKTSFVLQPKSKDALLGWQEYKVFLEEHRHTKDHALATRRSEHRQERIEQTRQFRQERTALYSGDQWNGESLNVARSLLAADQAHRKLDLQDKHRQERKADQERFGSRLSFEQFLRNRGQEQLAEKWRYREHTDAPGYISGDGEEDVNRRDVRSFTAQLQQDTVRKKAYVGYFSNREPSSMSFADKGKQIEIYKTSDRVAVLAALQVASQKWGTLSITGPREFQLLCLEIAREHGMKIQGAEIRQENESRQAADPDKSGDASSPYETHKRDIQSKLHIANKASLDWMIAVRLRVTGHTQEAIAEQLLRHASTGRLSEERDWSKYAHRTAQAVFGERGSKETARYANRASDWAAFERNHSAAQPPAREHERMSSPRSRADFERG